MRTRLLATLVVAVMLAASCGSDGDDAESPDVTTAATDAAPAETTAAPDDTAPATTAAPETTTTAAAASEVTALTIGLQLEPPTLDLTEQPAAAIPQVLLYNVYETLVRVQNDGTIVPLLAESFEVSDDALTYTFVLRDGATFHNGDAVTVDDVVFSLTNVIEKDPPHPFAATFAAIESVEATDDATVVVTLTQPSANLLYFMTQGQGVILDQDEVGSLADSPVGTGPYRFESWTVGDSIELVRNDAYWGDPALLERVTFRYIADPNALSNAMLSEDIDILAGVSAPELLVAFESDDRFEVVTGDTYGEVVVSLNGRNAPLDDVRVRRAIGHAIDRQAVIDLAYAGYGTPIGSFSTPLDPWFEDLTGVSAYDPDLARELLADAGVSDLSLTMKLPPVSYATRSGEIIQSQLAEVGIDVELQNLSDFGTWLEDVFTNFDYDMSIVGHVEPRDIGSYGNPDYYWGYESEGITELIAAAEAEPDADARYAVYRQITEQLAADANDYWLFVLPNLSVIKPGVTGYVVGAPSLSLDITELAFNP